MAASQIPESMLMLQPESVSLQTKLDKNNEKLSQNTELMLIRKRYTMWILSLLVSIST